MRATLAVVLLVASVWVSTYFWIQTISGQAHLNAAIVDQFDQGLLHIDALGWGPAPGELWLLGVVIHDSHDRPGLTADSATLEFDLTATLTTGLEIRRAFARGVGVHLAWDEQGAFNLSRRWLAPSDEPPTRPRKGRPPVTVHDIVLEDSVVTLLWPTWSLRFEGVHAEGDVATGGGRRLAITAELNGQRASVTAAARTTDFDTHAIQGFVWAEGGFQTENVSLATADGSLVKASGEMGFYRGGHTDLVGEVSLLPPGEGTLLATWLPEGVQVDRLSMRRERPGPWTVAVTEASVPTLNAGSATVTGFHASLQGEFGSGGLLPHLALATEGAVAGSVEVRELFSAQSVAIDALDVSVGASVDASVDGLAVGSLTVADQTVGEIVVDGTVVANVGGGAIKGALVTDSGGATIAGPLETSVFRRRVDASMSMTFDAVRGALATWLRPWLPSDDRAEALASLTGKATARFALPASGRPSWSWTSVDWAQGAP